MHEEITESPLTPSCLVIGRRILERKEIINSITSDETALNKRARYLETCLKHFSSRFKTEYQSTLHEYHRIKNKIVKSEILYIFLKTNTTTTMVNG